MRFSKLSYISSAFHEDWGIVMSGGLDVNGFFLDDVMQTRNGEDFEEELASLPYAGIKFSAVVVNLKIVSQVCSHTLKILP